MFLVAIWKRADDTIVGRRSQDTSVYGRVGDNMNILGYATGLQFESKTKSDLVRCTLKLHPRHWCRFAMVGMLWYVAKPASEVDHKKTAEVVLSRRKLKLQFFLAPRWGLKIGWVSKPARAATYLPKRGLQPTLGRPPRAPPPAGVSHSFQGPPYMPPPPRASPPPFLWPAYGETHSGLGGGSSGAPSGWVDCGGQVAPPSGRRGLLYSERPFCREIRWTEALSGCCFECAST